MLIESLFFRRVVLQVLMNITARGLQQPAERLWTRTSEHALQAYAEYTARHLKGGVSEQLLQRLNSEAYRAGLRLRRLLCIRSRQRAERTIVGLYRNIGITMGFNDSGQLCFHRCFFSRYYTPGVCRAASALDDGIIRGVLGQQPGTLQFSQRITEGNYCCRAALV